MSKESLMLLSNKELDTIRKLLKRHKEVALADKQKINTKEIAKQLLYPSDERIKQFFSGTIQDEKLNKDLKNKIVDIFISIPNFWDVLSNSRIKNKLNKAIKKEEQKPTQPQKNKIKFFKPETVDTKNKKSKVIINLNHGISISIQKNKDELIIKLYGNGVDNTEIITCASE